MRSAIALLEPRSAPRPEPCGLLRTCIAQKRGRSAAAIRMPKCRRPPLRPVRRPPDRCRHPHPLRFARRSRPRQLHRLQCPAPHSAPRCRRQPGPQWPRPPARWRIAGRQTHRRGTARSSCPFRAAPSSWDRSVCSRIRPEKALPRNQRDANVYAWGGKFPRSIARRLRRHPLPAAWTFFHVRIIGLRVGTIEPGRGRTRGGLRLAALLDVRRR